MFHRYALFLRCLFIGLVGLVGEVHYAAAQNLASRSYTIADGLPQTVVYAICQDEKGRLWAGTQGGVCSFDGQQFRTLDVRQGLSDNHVTAVAAAADGTLWLGHEYGGVSSLRNGQLRRCRPRGLGTVGPVRQVYPAGGGIVWVATAGNGLLRLKCSPADTVVSRYTTKNGLPSDSVNYVGAGPAGQLWVATAKGVVVFNSEQPLGVAGAGAALPAELRQASVNSVFKVCDTLLWCATNTGLLRASNRLGRLWQVRRFGETEGLCDTRVLRVIQDRRGRVWAATASGLSRAVQGGRFNCFGGRNNLISDQAHDLLEDQEGNVWIVHDNGLTQHLADERFTQYTPQDGLPDNQVLAILAVNPREYWIGTRLGIVRFRPGSSNRPLFEPVPLRPGALGQYVRCLFQDRRGQIWLGTRGGGAARYNPATKRWTYFDDVPGLAGQRVYSIGEDARGRVWLATREAGATVFDPATDSFRTFDAQHGGLGTYSLWKVFRDRRGTLWLGTDDIGLVRVDTDHDQFQRVPGQPKRLSIGSISEDQHGNLWLGSIGSGLLRYDGRTMRGYGLEVGLQSNNPYFVQCDSAGRVWLGTNLGLDCFNPSTGRAMSYGLLEGFAGQETNQNAVVLTRGNQLWIGTINGLMHYDPAGVQLNPRAPGSYLTRLRIFLKDTTVRSGLQLPHHLNHLTFDYVGVSLTNPAKVRYQYRLLGSDTRWSDPVSTTSVTYTNLPPGDYDFQLRAANNDGVWNMRPASFRVTIKPPWWARWWAYVLYAGLFGAMLYGVRRVTQQRERERADRQLQRQALEHLQVLDRMKSDFFANISHEFRTPLTLILGPAELLADDPPIDATQVRQQGSLIVRHARKLLQLINQLLDLSKLEAGALHLNAVPGDATLFGRRLLAPFASLASSQHITLRLQAPTTPVPLVFDPEKLEEIVSNLLANALRFTPAGGEVVLIIKEEPSSAAVPFGAVRFEVRDTGPGISPEHQPRLFERFYQAPGPDTGGARTGTGLGLALVKELTELHCGTVTVASKLGQGATFSVWLPRQAAVATTKEPTNESGATKMVTAAEVPPKPLSATDFEASPVAQEGYLPTAVKTTDTAALPAKEEPRAEVAVVLVIEDQVDMRQFICETLAPGGYHLLEAADGTAGVALAREVVPDLVLSDIMMPPGPDGYQVCEQLKTDPTTSHIPVVLLTARADPRDKLQGLETGADAYVAKPFNPRELQAQVRNLLALQQRLQARFVGQSALSVDASSEVVRPVGPAPSAVVASSVLLSPLEQHAAAVAALPSLDQAFLHRVEQAVESHLDDGEFSVETLSQEVNLSRTQLHRKLKALTGQAPSDFIRNTRLLRAHALLQGQVGNVAEVAYRVGFNSPAHFSTSFSKLFGYAPSEVNKG
ncbi:two-component regulator propeller domain-containing protein [Hymenobacter sp. YC55]|uniref:two-component regulator propeller domain-containing protein n=1 Tax=Hymenobacter sp. YC55 TaxID=3034019 RepID=UPI0023F71DFB|nr:two-component regulator propeller domain-containing protein [Hymenobacter sp. YC55]MDF7809891.1 two-component regulator propeller domain-containing protein [Hymenobacter sp. YC55]